MYVVTKPVHNMPLPRTFGTCKERDFVLNTKRKLPDTDQDHQDKPEKIPKLDDDSQTETKNAKPPPDLSPRLKTVTPNELNSPIQRYHSTRTSRPEYRPYMPLPLKVKFESSVRRFSVSEFTTFKDLKMILARRMLEDKVMAIEYKDDQGERVVLSSEHDMVEFSRISRERGMKPMQVRVNLWPR